MLIKGHKARYYVPLNNLKRLRFLSVIVSNVMITVYNYLANFQYTYSA
nr:MAG TPA: hypothetical protein [Caudoviricetes sp.]